MKSTRTADSQAPTPDLSIPTPITSAETISKTRMSGVYRLPLGEFTVWALLDGANTRPLDRLLTDTTLAALAASSQLDKLPAMVELTFNTFLIDTGGKRVLVDTGRGDSFKPQMSDVVDAGHMLDSLKNAGYTPEQVDVVLLTHIHGDHFCGLARNGKPAFPNATVYANRLEADFWLNKENLNKAPSQAHQFEQAEAILRLYANINRLETFEGHAEIVPGIRAVPGYGHTPGHSFYAIESKGEKMLLWGDLVHIAAVQFPYPASMVRFDVDPKAAAAQREQVLKDAVRQGYWVGAAHISFPGIGHVHSAGNAYQWVPAE